MSTQRPHGEEEQKHLRESELQDKLQRLRAEEKKLHLAQSRHEEGQIRAGIRAISKEIFRISRSPHVSEKSPDTRRILLDIAPTAEAPCSADDRAETQIFRLENQHGVVPVFETGRYYKGADIRCVSSINIRTHPLLVDGPVYISNSRDCTMHIAARQVRLVSCHGLNLKLHSETGVCLEKSSGIRATPMHTEQTRGIPWAHDPQTIDFSGEQRI